MNEILRTFVLSKQLSNDKNLQNMNTQTITSIANFLKGLSTYIDVLSLIDIDNINLDDPYYSIENMIRDNNGFDIEIIYYTDAIKYLAENDCSLRNSLEIAAEMGYEIKNINSELLASLLASSKAQEDFFDLKGEIETFFEELKEEEEEG